MGMIEDRLSTLGIQLPPAPAPAANYVPAVRSGNLVVIAGQVCFGADGKLADGTQGQAGRGRVR
jgi:enamine deaminase RidA (YjgF/YER057c/UK114 family)